MTLKQRIQTWHYRPHTISGKLWVALMWLPSIFYSFGVQCRRWCYEWKFFPTVQLNIPVISVGNLTTGGTGKSPVVIALAKQFLAEGKKVVVLSRGYGATDPQPYARANKPSYGDEAFMIQQAVPDAIVIVGRNRAENAVLALAEHEPDVILLDDGFQYWRLHRTMDIVLVDGELGLGNGLPLPAGPLRDPKQAIKRAHQVWLTRPGEHTEAIAQKLKSILPFTIPIETISFGLDTPYPLLREAQKTTPSEWVSVCGIAQPEQFLTSLRTLGFMPVEEQIFEDHQPYTKTDTQPLCKRLEESPTLGILTTEKDAVKLQPLFPPHLQTRLYAVPLKVSLPHIIIPT